MKKTFKINLPKDKVLVASNVSEEDGFLKIEAWLSDGSAKETLKILNKLFCRGINAEMDKINKAYSDTITPLFQRTVKWEENDMAEKGKKSNPDTKQIENVSQNYNMSFEDAQDYISKCGFDIPWNDGDVFVDDREITRTIGNVLKWRINSVWHDAEEEPKRNAWFLAQIGDCAFDTFIMQIESNRWDRWCNGLNIKRWAYIDDLLPERKEESI